MTTLSAALNRASTTRARSPDVAPLVPAVARAVAVLDRLAERRQPTTAARLAADMALPKSSVHGLCNTLLALGYLRRHHDGSLSIGPRVMRLAEAFVAGTDVAREFDALWQDIAPTQAPDETVLLSVLDGCDVVYLAARHGTQPLGLAYTKGMRLPAHLAATGLAMLAFLGDDAVHQHLGPEPLSALTPRSPTDHRQVAEALATTRRRGYSIDDEGLRLGIYCLAAPVFDAGGRPVAGVGVSLHKATLDDATLARQRQRVIDTARSLTQRLGGAAPPVLSSTSTAASRP